MRLLTLNVHKGFTFLHRRFVLRELREAIRATDADLVFLQEVVGTNRQWARTIRNWPSSSQYEFLADEIWPSHAYGGNAVTDIGDFGNAVLSREPIHAWDNVDVSVASAEPRALLHCRIGAGASPLHAICVHLGLREAHRRRQLQGLQSLIEGHIPADAPLIVAGDFNDWRNQARVVMCDALGMQEVHEHHDGSSARTFPARRPIFRLDRIYLRNFRCGKPIRLPRQPWSSLSDHLPVMASVAR